MQASDQSSDKIRRVLDIRRLNGCSAKSGWGFGVATRLAKAQTKLEYGGMYLALAALLGIMTSRSMEC